MKAQAISIVIAPLIESGDAILMESPPEFDPAPGVLVSVTKKGLGSLFRHSLVKHISLKPSN